jgi:hypothetical protein
VVKDPLPKAFSEGVLNILLLYNSKDVYQSDTVTPAKWVCRLDTQNRRMLSKSHSAGRRSPYKCRIINM